MAGRFISLEQKILRRDYSSYSREPDKNSLSACSERLYRPKYSNRSTTKYLTTEIEISEWRPFMFHLCTTAIFPAIYHKRKILDIRLNIKDFRLVGVTRFELATTRPPELNFTFSNKFNELYFNRFSTHSKSCNLPLSGIVENSRVPLVFHT